MNTTITDSRFQSAMQNTHVASARRCHRTSKPDTVKPNSSAALLQSAVEVRQTLRGSLTQVNDLIREVKAQRKQDRLLQTTMDSLRKLSLA